MKYLPFTMKKNTARLSLVLLLIASMIIVGVSPVRAVPTPTVHVNPSYYVVSAPGESFTVEVNVTSVTDFGSWEFKLDFNATLLNATYVDSTWFTANNTDWIPTDAFGTFHPDGPPTINNTIGRVYVGALVPAFPGSGPSGDFPLVKINFTATDKTQLLPANCSLHLYSVVLGDSWGAEITPVNTSDGLVTVIPEFPATVITLLLLVATLVATFLAKMSWSRKRKDALIAE